MVIWLIGLSGAGKTTLANKVVADANNKNLNTVLIDGDVVREIFGNDLDYSIEGRLLNAKRICQLGKFLDDQGLNVVCAILSIFPENRDWNRKNLNNYYEVFIDTPIENLIKRDTKGIYGKYERGEISSVAGMDIEFPIPDKADLVIRNDETESFLLSHSKIIVDILKHKND
jgi:cytidine diphosphoramidate kinase